MKFCITLLLLSSTCFAQNTIIPAPAKLAPGQGTFVFNASTVIKADDNNTARFFSTWLKSNKHLTKGTINQLVILSKGADHLPSEGYALSITPNQITVTGKGAGLFYGMQTLIQLFPDKNQGTVELPCLTIEDHPRYGYRGLMLDVSRHFFNHTNQKEPACNSHAGRHGIIFRLCTKPLRYGAHQSWW